MFVSQYVCFIVFTLLYLGSYLDTECYGFHILDYTKSNYTSRIKRQICGFRCANGRCVDGDSKCNGISDCADGSDESPQICSGTPVTPPILSDGSCARPPQPANGKFTSDQSLMKLNYSCSSGYQLYPSPNNNVVICESGEWYPGLPECLGTTVQMSCKHLYSQVDPSAYPLSICWESSCDYSLIKCVPECGNKMPGRYTFVIESEHTNKGEFPWHVGIYKLNDSNQYEQRCGGSIISRNFIVSAAHCFTKYENGAPYDTKLYAIAAGKYYRNYYEEKDISSQKSTVKKIIIPERYKGIKTSYTADIALVILDKALEIIHVVQPVCIDWNNEYEVTQLRDHNNGIVVGWGYTKEDQDPSVELKQLSVPFINFKQCYESVPESFTRFLTNDKFCAGFANGSGVCHGDSGGGLVFKKEDTEKYYLRGLVSVGPLEKGKCDSRQYATYTKVSDYMAMLRDVEVNSRPPVTPSKLPDDSCSLPPQPAIGRYTTDLSLTKLTYSCSPGYQNYPSANTNVAICYLGKWLPNLPVCALKSCMLQPNNATGQCVLLNNCPKAIDNLQKGIYPQTCGNDGIESVVCCAIRVVGDISKEKCKEYGEKVFELEYPGVFDKNLTPNKTDTCAITVDPSGFELRDANPREYPHMALLGAGERNNITWICSGTVISEQFVLTAARCLEVLIFSDPVRWIRVGELVLRSNTDEAQPQDFSVLESIKHPQYSIYASYYNDIGLVKVNGQIRLNRYVRPACLHTTTFINTTQYITTGWGKTYAYGNRSDTLQRVILDSFSQDSCNTTYRGSSYAKYGIVPETQICAGPNDTDRDLCEFGAPLQIFSKEVHCMYNIVGVQSFGLCGRAGLPKVFTRVSHYIDWIEKTVWPEKN